MRRTITLSLLMLLAVGASLPLVRSTAHGVRQSVSSSGRRSYRRHSRAWWRRYRARLRRRRAAVLAAHRNSQLNPSLPRVAGFVPPVPAQMPDGWTTVSGTNSSEMRFRSIGAKASLPGQVSFAVVALSRPNPAYLSAREQSRMLSGVNVADLRGLVIDKMMHTGGWVINDYVRTVGGQRVFVVIAQTPADGNTPETAWGFYFTEINGRIYGVTTNTPLQFSDRMANEAEKFIDSLRSRGDLQTK